MQVNGELSVGNPGSSMACSARSTPPTGSHKVDQKIDAISPQPYECKTWAKHAYRLKGSTQTVLILLAMNRGIINRQLRAVNMDLEAVRQEKRQLRRQIQEVLTTLSPDEVAQQSSIITEKALSLPEYNAADSISIFLSMPAKEVSTKEIVKQAFKDGKKVYVPYISPSRSDPKLKIMDMLRLRDQQDLESLQPDSWGIPSLSAQSVSSRENALGGSGCYAEVDDGNRVASRLDLIFMPSMAFDTSLNRLGHGKGFYDRYLTLCQSLLSSGQPRSMPHLVGLALNEQMLPPERAVPTDELDWKVDKVVTPDS